MLVLPKVMLVFPKCMHTFRNNKHKFAKYRHIFALNMLIFPENKHVFLECNATKSRPNSRKRPKYAIPAKSGISFEQNWQIKAGRSPRLRPECSKKTCPREGGGRQGCEISAVFCPSANHSSPATTICPSRCRL